MPRPTPPSTPRRPRFFGLHFDLHPHDGDTELGKRVTPALVRRILDAARPDFVQYDCKGHVGFLGYPRSKVSRTAGVDGGKGIVGDSLAVYRKATRARGVALLVHFSGVWDGQAVLDHPDWAVHTPDGQRSPHSTSLWSPYVRQRMIPQMMEVIDRYQVDGFWVDGDCWSVWADHHPQAIADFRARTGLDAPPTRPGQPGWLDWTNLHREKFFEYVRTYRDAVKQRDPSVMVVSNWMYSPMCPEPVRLPMDHLSGDYTHSDSINSARFNGRVMSSYGQPWDLMAWAFTNAPGGLKLHKPAVQLQAEAAVVLALGGGFQMYFNPDRDGGFAPAQVQTMRDVADFCHPRRAACYGGATVPQVAVLLDTTDFYRRNPGVMSYWTGEHDAVQGTLQALLERGHACDVLCDHHLDGRWSDWPVIVVPEAAELGDATIAALRGYVAGGGALLLLGAGCVAPFGDLLGVTAAGEPDDSVWLLQGERGGATVLGPWQPVTPRRGRGAAQPLLFRTRKFDPAAQPQLAATFRRAGKGRIAALYGAAGLTALRTHDPALLDALDSLLRRLYEPLVTVQHPRGLDLSVRRQRESLVVHLVNTLPGAATTGATPTPENLNTASRYPAFDFVPALDPGAVTVRLARRPRRVTRAPGKQRVPWTWRGGVLRCTVPPVAVHTALVID